LRSPVEPTAAFIRQGERDSVSCYQLIEVERASFPVPLMCSVLGVSRSSYYGWRGRPPSATEIADANIMERIEEIHK
jgi:putative transposase